MSTADMLAEVLRLPAEERARLALELIRSLSLDIGVEAGATEAWDVEIARRGAEVDAGVAETMTVDEGRHAGQHPGAEIADPGSARRRRFELHGVVERNRARRVPAVIVN
jgi:hypothetical protein